jgi:predicted NBD/HSP70 family sugar kinase
VGVLTFNSGIIDANTVYVGNQVRFASLFRGVSPDAFERRVRNMFLDLGRTWNVPFDVVNDGDVTALLGSMSMHEGGVLGIALGTSTAGGYVTAEGRITPWLNEIAFIPVDYRPDAPRDEWSGDSDAASSTSQQAVGRLQPATSTWSSFRPDSPQGGAGADAEGDSRARDIYQTVGAYPGYALAHMATVYDFHHVSCSAGHPARRR